MKERYIYWLNLLVDIIQRHANERTLADCAVKVDLLDVCSEVRDRIKEIELKEKNLNLFSEENQSV